MRLLRRIGLVLAAPVLAIVFSLAVTSIVLLTIKASPLDTFRTMFDYAMQPRTQVLIINSAVTYYFAAVAVAIGFRMNLFNIGVDGQYRLAAMLAASVGGAVALPAPLHVGLILVTAMLVGGLWAAVAGGPQGAPRGQRGHLDDHAELRRDRAHRLPARAGSARGHDAGVEQPRHQADPAVRSGAGHLAHPRDPGPGVRPHRAGGHRRRRLLVRAQPDQVRVRPARHRHERGGRRGQRRGRARGW